MATMLDKTRDAPQNEAKAPAPPPQAERAAPQVDARKPDEPPKDDPKAKSGGIVGTLVLLEYLGVPHDQKRADLRVFLLHEVERNLYAFSRGSLKLALRDRSPAGEWSRA